MNKMEVHHLCEMTIIMVSEINAKPRDIKLRTFLLDSDEILKQKHSRDLVLKVLKKVLFLEHEEPPPEAVCKLLKYSLKEDIRVHLPISDISHAWKVPIHKLELKSRHLESKMFSTGRAYFWESLIDCYGDKPGMP